MSDDKNRGGEWDTIPDFICLCHIMWRLFEKKLNLEDTHHIYLHG